MIFHQAVRSVLAPRRGAIAELLPDHASTKRYRGHPTRRNVEPQDYGVSNTLEVQPQGEVTNFEFQDVILIMSQVVVKQASEQKGDRRDVANTSRICELLRMNPPDFTSSSVTEDSENFVEELQKVFEVIERVELYAYQLKGVAKVWYNQWKKSIAKGAPIVEEDKLRYREESWNKKSKTTRNESGQ
ncbi:uncharacterized protein LOC125863994 [Solanum stenotomum]|uniref:uncharacterized protein LOC125863994 n=1 Tax=Solanum stenotomum TaxID=172797 RepID=UPI0020D1EC43|nr:uncharacterized protein LOC125863994 [Solanum stenotomum]